jgi:DNA-binding LacI/PurR family transcriptional regulator
MRKLQIRSAAEQLADYLKDELQAGTWTEFMPGESWLVHQLQVGRDTVRAAMTQLEAEGVLLPQGHGRRRTIAQGNPASRKAFQVALLLSCPEDRHVSDLHDIMRQLSARGHQVKVAPKSLTELGMNVERLAKMVKHVEADGWVVCSASREVLTWFSERPFPAFALFGIFSKLPIAGMGPDKFPAYRSAIRHLVELGHRRIVLLHPEHARKPQPRGITRRVLDEMESLGIKIGPYHLPDWQNHPAGLRQCLDSLFDLTPPTALIIDEAHQFLAVRHHLAERGIFAPRDVSLVCSDDSPVFKWYEPSVSCIRWSMDPLVRRLVRWVDNIANGKEDRRAGYSSARFIEGGTIGPVRNSERRRS